MSGCVRARGQAFLALDCQVRFQCFATREIKPCTFHIGCEIGVDIEQIRPLADLESIARNSFVSRMQGLGLQSVSRSARAFQLLDAKRGFIKAVGAVFRSRLTASA